MEPHVLCIDPSQRYLGYAYRDVYNNCVRIGHIEQLTANHVDWRRRALLMATQLAQQVEQNYAMDNMRPVVVVMEVPDNWHTERGNDSKNSEAVQKLYFTAGAIIAHLQALPFVQAVWTVLPKEWKGSTPKTIMMRRFKEYCIEKDVPLDCFNAGDDDAAEAALLSFLCYAKQRLHDDESIVTFEPPYVLVYEQGSADSGQFNTEVYFECDTGSEVVRGHDAEGSVSGEPSQGGDIDNEEEGEVGADFSTEGSQ